MANHPVKLKSVEIIVIGALNVDLTCYTKNIPRKNGEIVLGEKFYIGYGGRGGNMCAAASMLGAESAIIGRMGSDNFGKDYLLKLRRLLVNVDGIIKTKDETTGLASVTVTNEGGNCQIVVPAANNQLTPRDLERFRYMFHSAKVALFSFEVPNETVLAAMHMAKEEKIGSLIVCPNQANLDPLFYQMASIVVVNETELEITTGDEVKSISDAFYALKKLMEFGAEIALVTLGRWGALYLEKGDTDNPIRVMVSQVDEPIDTTGAGDSFVATLAYTIVHYPEMVFKDKVRVACEVARTSITKQGTIDSYPLMKEVAHLFPDEDF